MNCNHSTLAMAQQALVPPPPFLFPAQTAGINEEIVNSHHRPYAPVVVNHMAVDTSHALIRSAVPLGANRHIDLPPGVAACAGEGEIVFVIQLPRNLGGIAVYPVVLNSLPRGLVSQLGVFVGILRATHYEFRSLVKIDAVVYGPVPTMHFGAERLTIGDMLRIGEQPINDQGLPIVRNSNMQAGRVLACFELACPLENVISEIDPVFQALDEMYAPMNDDEKDLCQLPVAIAEGLFLLSILIRMPGVSTQKVAAYTQIKNNQFFKLKVKYRKFYPTDIDVLQYAETSGSHAIAGKYVQVEASDLTLQENAMYYWISLYQLVISFRNVMMQTDGVTPSVLTPTELQTITNTAINDRTVLPLFAVLLDLGRVSLPGHESPTGADKLMEKRLLFFQAAHGIQTSIQRIANPAFSLYDVCAIVLDELVDPSCTFTVLPI